MKLILSVALSLCVVLSVSAPTDAATRRKSKRAHKQKVAKRAVAQTTHNLATPADLEQLIKAFSDAEIRAELARRTLPNYPAPMLEAEATKRGLADFTNKEIRAELNRRLLSAYSLLVLQREAELRGIQ